MNESFDRFARATRYSAAEDFPYRKSVSLFSVSQSSKTLSKIVYSGVIMGGSYLIIPTFSTVLRSKVGFDDTFDNTITLSDRYFLVDGVCDAIAQATMCSADICLCAKWRKKFQSIFNNKSIRRMIRLKCTSGIFRLDTVR